MLYGATFLNVRAVYDELAVRVAERGEAAELLRLHGYELVPWARVYVLSEAPVSFVLASNLSWVEDDGEYYDATVLDAMEQEPGTT
jgi:hypothetical protein